MSIVQPAIDLGTLQAFIVEAKAAAYVGNGTPVAPSRPASHDIGWQRDRWRYLDSYFGGTDFLGQETVWWRDEPVWAMNYHGYILRDDLIDAARAGGIIKAALAALYTEGRFLGGYRFRDGGYDYRDRSDGDVARFDGREGIWLDGVPVYELRYHGGLIRP